MTWSSPWTSYISTKPSIDRSVNGSRVLSASRLISNWVLALFSSLLRRLRSREGESYTDKLLSVTRNQFGGHAVKKKE